VLIKYIIPFRWHKETLISFGLDLITNEPTGGCECASGRAGAGQRTKKDEKAAPHKELAQRSFYFACAFDVRACVFLCPAALNGHAQKRPQCDEIGPKRGWKDLFMLRDEWPKKFQSGRRLFANLFLVSNRDRNWKFLACVPYLRVAAPLKSWKFVKLISLKFIQSVEGLSFHVVKRRPLKYLRFAARHSRGGAPPEWIRAEGGRCEQSGRLIAILGTFRTHGTATGTASTCRVPRCARSHFIYPKTHQAPTNCKLKMSSKAVISTNRKIN